MHKTKTDRQLKEDVEAELRADPRIDEVKIGVTVDGGAVSLLGAVGSFAQRWAAEDAVKRVHGVRGLAKDLVVTVLAEHTRSDTEIAVALTHALEWDVIVPNDVSAKVDHGVVTLTGTVEWNYERDAAVRAVRFLAGVTAVNDFIRLLPRASAERVRESIESALQRQMHADASSIHVQAVGGKVTLTGHASSWQSIEDAAHAAWAAPGVTEVIDQIHMSAPV